MPAEFIEYLLEKLAPLDDRELLCAWARKGIEAAACVAAKKKPRKK